MLELLVNLLCSRKIARNWCTLEKKVVVSMADSPLRDDAMPGACFKPYDF